MKKVDYYAPYYNKDYFKKLSTDNGNELIEMWGKRPSVEGTKQVMVADFTPVSNLKLPRTDLKKLSYGIVDGHNHLDGYLPEFVQEMMDKSGIEYIMNLSTVFREKEKIISEQQRLTKVLGDRLLSAAILPWHKISQEGAVQTFCNWLEEYRELGINAFKVHKVLGLVLRDEYGDGRLLQLDDERFDPIWEKLGELKMPVFIHQADPEAFFHPIDKNNERLEELGAHRDWHFYDEEGKRPGRQILLGRLEKVIKKHPNTIFISVHVGNDAENLQNVDQMLEKYPNMWIDIAARVAELGRQPNMARKFLMKNYQRTVFGTDLPPHPEMYKRYRRFFETDDDHFMYPTHVSGQGNWRISGINLPEEVVKRIYRDNLLELLGIE